MEYELKTQKSKACATSIGAEFTDFTVDGISYIWQPDAKYWKGQNPILFPTVGSVKDGKTIINGKEYPMTKHGFVRGEEWELVDHQEDRITFLYRSNDFTKTMYPFEFELYVSHQISENGFNTTFTVKNTDKNTIVYGLGGHPGFNCPLFLDDKFSDYDVVFDTEETGPFYYTCLEDCGGIIHRDGEIKTLSGVQKISLNYGLFDRDVIILTNMKSKSVSLRNRTSGKGVKMEIEGFNVLGIWTAPQKNAPYICLEPWTCTPDFEDASGIFEEKTGIVSLESGKEHTYSFKVTIIA